MFLTMIMLALLIRVAPQMNIFSVGLALRVAMGLLATLMFLPGILMLMGHVLGKAWSLLASL